MALNSKARAQIAVNKWSNATARTTSPARRKINSARANYYRPFCNPDVMRRETMQDDPNIVANFKRGNGFISSVERGFPLIGHGSWS